MRKPEKYVPHCDLCDRIHNDVAVLVEVRKPGELFPLHICGNKKCRDHAESLGYYRAVTVQ